MVVTRIVGKKNRITTARPGRFTNEMILTLAAGAGRAKWSARLRRVSITYFAK